MVDITFLAYQPRWNSHNGTLAEKFMKAEKEIKKILDKYSILYTDWIPADDGRVKKTINENKKGLLLRALLDLVLLVERSLNK